MKKTYFKALLLLSVILLSSIQFSNAQCPTITCPSNVSVNNDPGVCGAVVNFTAPVGTNPCYGAQTFSYTGTMQTWTVPAGVTSLTIDTYGAKGGDGINGVIGGYGARIKGDIVVTPGQILKILVGGQGVAGIDGGEQAGGTGGGGSFVTTSTNTPLIIAGGGGGAMGRSGLLVNGGPGQITLSGQNGGTNGGIGGTGGSGGGTWPWTGWHSGTGGGGLLGDGSAPSNGSGSFGTINGPGIAFINGGAGGIGGSMGRSGGFGGGGAAGFTGGGGGGYSGGGSGTHDSPPSISGGGGGSYNGGINQTNTAGVQTGNGQVIITFVPATVTQTFNYTGAMQTWTVPAGVTSVTIDAYGAEGVGRDGFTPGQGGRAKGDLTVTPGQVINIFVGGQAQWNGGGWGKGGANGGDASDVRVGGTALADRVIVAGGGGGTGGDNWSCFTGNGDGGGGTVVGTNFVGGGGGSGYSFCGANGGNTGGTSGAAYHGGGGGGGGLTSGGAGANANGGGGIAGNGTLGVGGASNDAPCCTNTGGGGGGYYGGGGAAGTCCGAGQGGGGSSWTGTLANPLFAPGFKTGNGQVVITYPLLPTTAQTAGLPSGSTFPVGTTTQTFVVTDQLANTATCSFTVTVTDNEVPVTPTIANATGECSATATAPTTTDNCAGTITGTTTDPLTYNTQGSYTITWTFDDGNGNTTTQTQNVIVDDVSAPVTPTIADATGECSATATAPTTTDNCAGTITGTTTDPLTYNTQGSYTITWTFDDGNGNTTTASQNVVVDDVSAPITPTIADATGECSATATAPTTTDNCAGTITGTTTDPLTYSTQGTYTITWTFDDGNGNTTTQTQNVVVDDVTVPVTPTLADATGECSATATAPTTTDVCAGTITGTTLTTFPITTQGTTVVTWTFDDGNGNTTTANQNVIVDDVTAPTFTCPTDLTACPGEVLTIAPSAIADNCAGTVTVTYALTGATNGGGPDDASGVPFNSGVTTVTYTFDDGNGNTDACSFDLTMGSVDTAVTVNQATLTATGTGTYQWYNCGTSTIIAGATSASYTATANGSYAVIVTNGSCVDTSSCHSINVVGLSDNNSVTNIQVYPNPSNGQVNIDLPEGISPITIGVYDVDGKQVYFMEKVSATHTVMNLKQLSPGVYFIKLNNEQTQQVVKLIKL